MRAAAACVLAGGIMAVGLGHSLAAQAVGTGGASTTPFALGISPGAGIQYLGSALSPTMSAMAGAGSRWVRLDIDWPAVQNSAGEFDWSLSDATIASAEAAGLNVLAVPTYTPDWAKLPSGYPDPVAYANFVSAAVARYGPQGVRDWEIWNEENIASNWGPKADPVSYTALLKAASGAIWAVQPDATVITGGLAPAGDASDGSSLSPDSFVSGIYAAGGKGYFSAVGSHPYSFPDMPMQPDSWNPFVNLPAMHQIMVNNGDGAKQIWLTEYGAPTGSTSRSVSESTQAAMVTQAARAAGAWSWAGPLFWYNWQDDGSDPTNWQKDMGLLNAPGSPKASLAAFSSAAAAIQPVGSSPAPTNAAAASPAPTSSVPAPATGTAQPILRLAQNLSTSGTSGYTLVGSLGQVTSYGTAAPGTGPVPAAPVVAAASTPDGHGYWLASSAGTVTANGDATNFGSPGGVRLAQPIVSMATTPDGEGYWLVARDGGVFTFGDAGYFGSTGAERLNQPIVGMAPTADGLGYWLVAADGGLFSFGDAVFHGSTGAERLAQPIVGMATTPDGQGYWLVARDGGIFSFGDAVFHGSTGGEHLARSITSMAPTADGQGYWLVAGDGGVFTFGDANFAGSGAPGQTVGILAG
ncbi:MAG TPA: hypothetical protein VNF50_08355 [Acidimicrobiales bacterium]|nr:hypothetical protein [Acidimicrobiales bacterium]